MISGRSRSLEIASKDYDLKKKYDFRKIEIIKDFASLPMVECIETEIEQVILNLLKNSAQALGELSPEDGPPCIKISTAPGEGEVIMTISDNGPGIPEYSQKHIFEPFYTTKTVGVGTGLGLSVSYYIINKSHHGTIMVEPTSERGTAFRVTLPLEQPKAP